VVGVIHLSANQFENFANPHDSFWGRFIHPMPNTQWQNLLKQDVVIMGFHTH
jgi:hypothetical protein